MRKSRFIMILLIILFSAAILLGCRDDRAKPNQQKLSTSPNGKYLAQVSIIEKKFNNYLRWWQFKFFDNKGNAWPADTLKFPARFNIYWIWDKHDRLWVYNSDDGRVYYYEIVGGWPCREWIGSGKGDPRSRSFYPPEELYPEYVKKKLN